MSTALVGNGDVQSLAISINLTTYATSLSPSGSKQSNAVFEELVRVREDTLAADVDAEGQEDDQDS